MCLYAVTSLCKIDHSGVIQHLHYLARVSHISRPGKFLYFRIQILQFLLNLERGEILGRYFSALPRYYFSISDQHPVTFPLPAKILGCFQRIVFHLINTLARERVDRCGDARLFQA